MKPSLVIIGLGNPGASYERTRHNAGWQALEVLSESFGQSEWKDAQKFQSEIQEARIVTVPVLLVKPHTYMNRSGEAARKIVDFYKLNPAEQMLILSDDIDLPLAQFRLRRKGGPGTHNGLKSLVEQFGEDFPRLRIGIGPKPDSADLATWVLSAFTKEEYGGLQKLYATFPEVVRAFVLEQGNGAES
jgi:peptidyl-tRNA hydrolase, PTH1 family